MRRARSRLAVAWLCAATGLTSANADSQAGGGPGSQPIGHPAHERIRGPAPVSSTPAAPDVPPESPPREPPNPSFDWNGWYAGGRMGWATGSSNWSATRRGAGAHVPRGSLHLSDRIDFSEGTG